MHIRQLKAKLLTVELYMPSVIEAFVSTAGLSCHGGGNCFSCMFH